MSRSATYLSSVLLLSLLPSGCGTAKTSPNSAPASTATSAETKSTSASSTNSTSEPPAESSKKRSFAPVEISSSPKTASKTPLTAAEQLDAIRTALKPFQVLLGEWNGLSRKTLSDHPQWAYDWVTNPKQPALRMRSEKSAYFRDGRLSYLPDSEQFEFKAVDADGSEKVFIGTFTEPVRDVPGDEKKPQRTYKLQLTEANANATGEQWRVTFNQQENNRYILELDRKRGSGDFSRVDTVHTQRNGTSFAVSDTDYGEKTCIISQGLGTISVSYKGQSFLVCCSGCKAAFEEDPEKWIAKWEEKKKAMGK